MGLLSPHATDSLCRAALEGQHSGDRVLPCSACLDPLMTRLECGGWQRSSCPSWLRLAHAENCCLEQDCSVSSSAAPKSSGLRRHGGRHGGRVCCYPGTCNQLPCPWVHSAGFLPSTTLLALVPKRISATTADFRSSGETTEAVDRWEAPDSSCCDNRSESSS